MIEHIVIIDTGIGGNAAATDLILQGKKVNLFEFPDYKENLTDLLESETLIASGAIEGEVTLEVVTSHIHEVIESVDTVMVCTQALAHNRASRELVPRINPFHLVILNLESTGGCLHFAQIFREIGLEDLPTLIETSTLNFGCREKKYKVEVPVKVNRVLYPSRLS